jgi:hypothetical protein
MVEILDRPVVGVTNAPEIIAPSETTGEKWTKIPRHVVVTKEHIKKGLAGEPQSCAIALALGAKLDGLISVNGEAVTFYEIADDQAGSQTFWLPMEAKIFVAQFDEGEEVEPFEFDLVDENPDPQQTQIEAWRNAHYTVDDDDAIEPSRAAEAIEC